MTTQKAQEIFHVLKSHYPKAQMILQWSNNFELLVSIILSAQCTDKKVNEVTSTLFPKYRKEKPELTPRYYNYMRMDIPKEQLIELVNIAYAPLIELEQD